MGIYENTSAFINYIHIIVTKRNTINIQGTTCIYNSNYLFNNECYTNILLSQCKCTVQIYFIDKNSN